MNADFHSRIPAVDNDRSGGDKSDIEGSLADVGRETTVTTAVNQTPQLLQLERRNENLQEYRNHQNQRHPHRHRHNNYDEQASVNQLNKPSVSTAITSCSSCSANTSITATTTTTTNDQFQLERAVCNSRTNQQEGILATCHHYHQESVVAVAASNTSDRADHSNHLSSTSSTSSPPLLHCYRCAADSVSSTAIAPTNNVSSACIDQQDTASEHSNNSYLFWKFISNLPKSITQRSKSNSSNTLTPEVAGYLASKRQCSTTNNSNNNNSSSSGSKVQNKHCQTASMTVTSNLDEQRNNTHYREDEKTAMADLDNANTDTGTAKSSSTKTTSATNKTPGESQKVDFVGGEFVAAQQVSQDGQILIKIITPPKMAHHVTGEPQQPQQIKLSIATITTTTTTNTRSSVSSLSSCILSESSNSEARIKWSKKMDFLLSIIGFAVDLANIWRFPYLVYKNGGGVFLIPYVTMLIFGGIPLFFLELCLGQFVKKGPITVWNKICPSMKGVGYCSILISWYVSFYYNILIAWSVYFIYRSLSSFGEKMPWEDCDNSWNSKGTCVSISQLKNLCSTRNESLEACRKEMFASVNVSSPASEFFVKELSQIDQSTGLDDMGYLRPELVLCTIVVYLLHYFSLFRGLETSGKVVWVTATAPYMILSILLVRGLFLPGASMGIEYYLSPKLEKLADPQVWIDAANQVFYSIGVGFGVHLTYASFNSHNNNCYRDCLMTSAVNAATSVYSGLVVFVYLGYMAKNLGIEIDKVASEGYSLVFEVYPEALTTLPFARFWSILFFIMLLTLGIDSAMGGLEAVITGLEDEFKFAKRLSRGQLTALVIVSSFIPALISCTQGGAYTLFWFDIYSAGVSLLFSALFETIGVVYCYGLSKFVLNIESMIGRKPHVFYIICWKYISPIFLGVVIIMSICTASVPTYRGYTFPLWSIILGWCLAFSSVSAVPIVAAWHWYTHRGKQLITPERSTRKRGSGSVASSRLGSKKSPNHRAVSVTCSAVGAVCAAQSHDGLTMTMV